MPGGGTPLRQRRGRGSYITPRSWTYLRKYNKKINFFKIKIKSNPPITLVNTKKIKNLKKLILLLLLYKNKYFIYIFAHIKYFSYLCKVF